MTGTGTGAVELRWSSLLLTSQMSLARALVAGMTTRVTTGGMTCMAGTGLLTDPAAAPVPEVVILGTSSVPAEEADPPLDMAEAAGAKTSPTQPLLTTAPNTDHD